MPQQHLVIPDTVEARLVTLGARGAISVITHALIPSANPVNVALADALFNSLKALWSAQLASMCPAAHSFARVELRDLRDQGFGIVTSTAAAAVGTAATETEALPPGIAAVLTVRTGKAGRKYRGRMYWGGFCEVANGSGGVMNAASKTKFDAFASGFIAAANVSGLQFGVAHRPTAYDPITGLPISPGLGFTTPATSVVCRDTTWDSQRRRAQ